jgi:molecular chaperone GrpE
MTSKKKKTEEEIEYIQDVHPQGLGEGEEEAPLGETRKKTQKATEPEAGKALKDKLKKRDSEVKLLKKEVEDLKDQYLRKLAEIENLRKRFEREKSDYLQFSTTEILSELLEIQDNFERALQSSGQDEEGGTFREGIELIYRMFQSFLTRKGVQPIEIQEKKFDPNLHHAMTMEESEEVEEPEVVEELQKGYTLHNRLLRPTLVKVAVPKKE